MTRAALWYQKGATRVERRRTHRGVDNVGRVGGRHREARSKSRSKRRSSPGYPYPFVAKILPG
jgi:hypothetical protein